VEDGTTTIFSVAGELLVTAGPHVHKDLNIMSFRFSDSNNFLKKLRLSCTIHEIRKAITCSTFLNIKTFDLNISYQRKVFNYYLWFLAFSLLTFTLSRR